MKDSRPVQGDVPRLTAAATRASLGLLGAVVAGVVGAGCASSSAPTANLGSSLQPRATAPSPGLTGIGATKAEWVAAHDGLNGGAFSAVKVGSSAGQPITGMRLQFAPVREGIARFNAASQLPADVKVAATSRTASCLQVRYTSQRLARESAVGPNVYAYFSSGPSGTPYNDQRVDRVILTGSSAGVSC